MEKDDPVQLGKPVSRNVKAATEGTKREHRLKRLWYKLLLRLRKYEVARRFELVLSVLAIISAVATYVAISRKSAPFEVTSGTTMRFLLIANLILILAMVTSIGRWFARIWSAKRLNAPGSRLLTRVVTIFSFIAIIPPIIMAFFSAAFLEIGVQSWFSENIRSTVNNSLEVAEAYLVEHRANLEKDLAAISFAYNRLDPLQQGDTVTLQQVATSAMTTRILSEIILFEDRAGQGVVLARAANTLELGTGRVPSELLNRVQDGDMVVIPNLTDNAVYGIIRLPSFMRPTYLFIARDLDPKVLTYLQATRSAVEGYENLEGKRSEFLIQFNVVFILVAFLILMAAIWVGLWFSSRLVNPISHLVDAAERVGKGDFTARVPHAPSGDEVGTLSRAFNRMTDKLSENQEELILTNQELDDRRRFLEEVLGGVSAGVIGVDLDGVIFLPNRSACELLDIPEQHLIGSLLVDVLPQSDKVLREAMESTAKFATREIQIEKDGHITVLLVRLSVEMDHQQALGYVVTFDDLTDQIADQRKAAWSDVARRIAHEIKNPLTPIQLSAERLNRKYSKEILTDPEVFNKCTETIIRQVGDLRRMVDEFSSFARMPAPAFKETDIVDVVKQAVFMQEVAWPDINITLQVEGQAKPYLCDGRLLGQAVTNLVKNAAESVTTRVTQDEAEGGTVPIGEIVVRLAVGAHKFEMLIKDNGLGLPAAEKDRLMDPYVTTRATGTGLGLAITSRIIEGHGGRIRLKDNEGGGAIAEVIIYEEALEKKAREGKEAMDIQAAPKKETIMQQSKNSEQKYKNAGERS